MISSKQKNSKGEPFSLDLTIENDMHKRPNLSMRREQTLPTNLVLVILKLPMTKCFRRVEKPGKQQEVFIRPGIEGFADGMSRFPRLKEWENQIALQALREGKTVDQLRTITPFRQFINAASRATIAGRDDPFTPFANLFDASPGIDMLVSFGNFHTIRTWKWTFAQRHPDLNLPLEQFFKMLFKPSYPHRRERMIHPLEIHFRTLQCTC